ncbi:MAG: hypothetical protein AB7I24_10140 [Candidatus Nanopelagicales bacterium]
MREPCSNQASIGAPLRLVATIECGDDGVVRARVAPQPVAAGDPLHGLGLLDLGLHFDGDLMPGLTVVGRDLEPRQTAYGVLVDVLGVLRGR